MGNQYDNHAMVEIPLRARERSSQELLLQLYVQLYARGDPSRVGIQLYVLATRRV